MNSFELTRKIEKYRKILFKDIDHVEKVGEGTFGQVYKAIYTEHQTGKLKQIAIKKFNYFEKDT